MTLLLFPLYEKAAQRDSSKNGAPGKIRTYDSPLRRRGLYPLSYGRTPGKPFLALQIESGGKVIITYEERLAPTYC
jgi:hypothetical protein